MTRYVIIGAGAVGGTIGARLAHAGADCLLVARGDHLRVMRERGLRLRTPDEDRTVPVAVAGGPDEVRLAEEDVLVVATKTQQFLQAVTAWVDQSVGDGTAGERLPWFCVTNGVAAENLALRYAARVYGVCVWLPANLVAPGEIVATGTPNSGVLHVGRVPSGSISGEDRQLLEQVADDWSGARLAMKLPDDVMGWKYRKLINNIGNVFDALLGDRDDVQPLVDAAREEARVILDAAGIVCTSDEEEHAARSADFGIGDVPGLDGYLGSSTWQSLQRDTGSIETDYLNGEIALLARRIGRSAPINTRLATLGRQAAAAGRHPGDLTPREVADALGL